MYSKLIKYLLRRLSVKSGGLPEVVLSIPDGNVLAGQLKRNKMKLVQAWLEIHKDELMANWQLASQGQTIFKIDPLR